MAVSINGNISNVIYGKGDVCLQLTPFDNYRMFTLYEDWRTDDHKPIDLSNGQKIYLVFKSKKKEIRIPEYDLINSNYTVDKVNGQVLFKISQKNAIDILDMDTNVFYITRVYEVTDYTGERVISSDEEVLYTGLFKDETSNTTDSYTSKLKASMGLLEDRTKEVQSLQESNVALIEQNTNYAAQVTDLQDEIDRLNSRISELEAKLAEYESGNEYSGTVIDTEATHHTIITGYTLKDGKEFTEEQMAEALRNLQIDTQE